jgi:hypothetical protein
VGAYLGGPRPRDELEREMPGAPERRPGLNARSMRLAAKLGFIEAGRFEAWGAEQWFGLWSPVTSSD